MKELKRQLMEMAREKGICVDGYAQMRTDNVEELVGYYIQNPDWCLERDYPTLDFLRENFSDIEDKGIYIDKTFHGEILNDRQAYIFHNCKGTIKVGLNVEMAIIPMLYVANNCRLRIIGIGECKPNRYVKRAEVPVYVFGENDLSAKDNLYVKFNHYYCSLI
ncbi:MAG: hypothetical protein NC311_09650 [Muribaculaceae bacterium]|nr:hypothetical protein [Muribaculaceae bacterium]